MTELVFILDRSGSMRGLETETIGGFNSMIEKQRREKEKTLVSLVIFDNDTEVVFDREPLEKIPELTDKMYYVRGSTALLDAVGGAVHHIGRIHKEIRKTGGTAPDKTLFVITTDGMENASRRYSYQKVREMIERKKSRHNWEFLFLGANIDAAAEAKRFGIDSSRAVRYHADRRGTALNFDVVSEAVACFRGGAGINDGWAEKIDRDYEGRDSD